MSKLSWKNHKKHYERLKEFYTLNKYFISEQLKDTLLDAIECMEYTMTAESQDYTVINLNFSDFWKEFYRIVSPDINGLFTYHCSYSETCFFIYHRGTQLNILIFNKDRNQFEWVDDKMPITFGACDKEIKKSISNAFTKLLPQDKLYLCENLKLFTSKED